MANVPYWYNAVSRGKVLGHSGVWLVALNQSDILVVCFSRPEDILSHDAGSCSQTENMNI